MFLSKYANKKHGTAARDASIGKLVKVAGNMLNTHSRYGDCRLPILAAPTCEGYRNKAQYPVASRNGRV